MYKYKFIGNDFSSNPMNFSSEYSKILFCNAYLEPDDDTRMISKDCFIQYKFIWMYKFNIKAPSLGDPPIWSDDWFFSDKDL